MSERNLPIVIEAIVEEIPADTQGDLISSLKDIQSSAAYAAPEGMRMWWGMLMEALDSSLPFPPETPWQEKVLAIVKDEVDVGARRGI